MKELLTIFFTFFRIGAFTFGGGYAMIPLIQHEAVEKHHWVTDGDILDIVAIAESTPGPIAINCATFVGYKMANFWGAVWATVGMIVPSFAVIFVISMFLDRFLEITVIANAFKGIQVAVGILILNAAINMIRKMKKKAFPIGVLAVSAGIMLLGNVLSWRVSSITLMLFAGVVSLALFLRKGGAGQ